MVAPTDTAQQQQLIEALAGELNGMADKTRDRMAEYPEFESSPETLPGTGAKLGVPVRAGYFRLLFVVWGWGVGWIVTLVFLLRFGMVLVRQAVAIVRGIVLGLLWILRLSPIFAIAVIVAVALGGGLFFRSRKGQG